MFKKLNKWFDSLNEPWRLVTTIIIATGYLLFIDVGLNYKHPVLIWIGIAWLIFAGTWAYSRALQCS